MALIAKVIKIVVHKGQNLEYCVPGSKKTAKTRRWRVIFIGGEKKQATHVVEAQDGFPQWNSEVVIIAPKPVDAIALRVTDGKDRHIGQVVIATTGITQSSAPPLIPAHLHTCELEPTKENAYPRGQLSYWMWAEEYWPEGTMACNGLSKSRSFKGSLSQIGAAFKSHSTMNMAGGDNVHSPPSAMTKLRNVKRRNKKPRGANGSVLGGYPTDLSRQSSVCSGSNALGWASEMGTSHIGSGDARLQKAPIQPGGTLSYNPFDEGAGSDVDALGIDEQASKPPMPLGENRAFIKSQSSWTLAGDQQSTNDLNRSSIFRRYRSRLAPSGGTKRSMLSKLKHKVSKSTANLSDIGHRKRDKQNFSGALGSAVGGSQIGGLNQLPIPRPGSANSFSCVNLQGETPRGSIYRQNDGARNSLYNGSGIDGMSPNGSLSGRPPPVPLGNRLSSVGSPVDDVDDACGMHPDERPNKNCDEMNKRELVDHTKRLEQRYLKSHSEFLRGQLERDRLTTELAVSQADLTTTRDELAKLRNRLLADNLTEYLERDRDKDPLPRAFGETSMESSPARLPRNTYMPDYSTETAAAAKEPFLARVTAIASRPFINMGDKPAPATSSSVISPPTTNWW